MSRIRHDENENINSDSFLDIVANIVGILIILIVIAGVRISQFPVGSTEQTSEPNSVMTTAATPDIEIVAPANTTKILLPELDKLINNPEELAVIEPLPKDEPNPYIAIRPPLPPLNETDIPEEVVELVPNSEIVTAVEIERDKLREMQQVIAEAEQNERNLTNQIAALDEELKTLNAKLREENRTNEDLQETLDKRKIDLLLAKEQRRKIQKLIDEELQKQELAAALKHTITPVAQVVAGKEIHFRLKDGKVSFVPIDELVDSLKTQVSRRKEWIARYGTHQGKVGPVEGYTMGYIASRSKTTVANDLRGGGISLRIGVEYWEVIDSKDIPTETEKEAIQPRSEFRQRLLSATNDTNITFWVYPDSYRIHRQLQDIARKYGYTVASRPLPHGVPIAGSPNGSRSAAQ